jgi:hypothetical protein
VGRRGPGHAGRIWSRTQTAGHPSFVRGRQDAVCGLAGLSNRTEGGYAAPVGSQSSVAQACDESRCAAPCAQTFNVQCGVVVAPTADGWRCSMWFAQKGDRARPACRACPRRRQAKQPAAWPPRPLPPPPPPPRPPPGPDGRPVGGADQRRRGQGGRPRRRGRRRRRRRRLRGRRRRGRRRRRRRGGPRG